MRYFITGGTGFVGCYVLKELAQAGHQIVLFDLSPNRSFLEDVLTPEELDQVRLVAGDVTDLPLILCTLNDAPPECIIHLAATLDISSEANPLRSLKVNCEGTVNIFEAALTFGVQKVVWASSIAVFGPSRRRPPGEVTNADFHQPNDLYGACKSLNEQLGQHYRRQRGLACTGVRFSVVYGYGKALTIARGTGADFLQQLIDQPALGRAGVVPHGDEILDFLYVTDAARAVVAASQTRHNPSIGLNICGSRHTIREVADHVKHLLPNAQIDVKPGTWGGGMHYEMATTEAEIGYSPQVPLAEGLRRNINDLRRLNGLPAI